MKPAFFKGQSFLDDVARHHSKPGLRLWWLGQSGFLLHWNGHYLCFDPYLSDSLTGKYANTGKPHVRITEQVIDPAHLGMVEVVTSSHNHTDHLDAETLNPMRAANPSMQLVLPEANRRFAAERLGCDPSWPIGLADRQSATAGPFTIEALPAAHEHLDPGFLGYVVTAGPHRIYHSGDCVLYPGLVERLQTLRPTLALLPINGSLPERRVAGNFWGREAAQLANDAAIPTVIPCHFDLFEFNSVTPDEFIDSCNALRQKFILLMNGEGVTL